MLYIPHPRDQNTPKYNHKHKGHQRSQHKQVLGCSAGFQRELDHFSYTRFKPDECLAPGSAQVLVPVYTVEHSTEHSSTVRLELMGELISHKSTGTIHNTPNRSRLLTIVPPQCGPSPIHAFRAHTSNDTIPQLGDVDSKVHRRAQGLLPHAVSTRQRWSRRPASSPACSRRPRAGRTGRKLE